MGDTVILPTRKSRSESLTVVSLPQFMFGKRVVVQAHQITRPQRADDVCDGHDVDQVFAKGDIKFFSKHADFKTI